MPWDHAAIGYVAFSIFVHAVYRDSPTARETFLVLFGAALPDLVDKPLAWQFGVLEGGRTLGHSVLIALPLSLAVGFLAQSRGWPRGGWAFGLGYLLHLPGDVVPASLRQGELKIDIVLWPITEGGGSQGGSLIEKFLTNVVPYADRLVESVATGELPAFLLVPLIIWSGAFLLWVVDGMPILREGYDWVRRFDVAHAQK